MLRELSALSTSPAQLGSLLVFSVSILTRVALCSAAPEETFQVAVIFGIHSLCLRSIVLRIHHHHLPAFSTSAMNVLDENVIMAVLLS